MSIHPREPLVGPINQPALPPAEPVVGLSLSFCVRDIVRGTVPIEMVKIIRAQTAAATPETFTRLLEHYGAFYWREFPDRAIEMARQLWQVGKIDQVRLRNLPALEQLNAVWCVPADDPYTVLENERRAVMQAWEARYAADDRMIAEGFFNEFDEATPKPKPAE